MSCTPRNNSIIRHPLVRGQGIAYVPARCCLQLNFTVEAHQQLTCTATLHRYVLNSITTELLTGWLCCCTLRLCSNLLSQARASFHCSSDVAGISSQTASRQHLNSRRSRNACRLIAWCATWQQHITSTFQHRRSSARQSCLLAVV